MKKETDKYKYCNHHHEITEDQELVNIGNCEFVADKKMIPLLKALNDLGLKTRTHSYRDHYGFFSIILDKNVEFKIWEVVERDSTRTEFNGKKELLISWKPNKVNGG